MYGRESKLPIDGVFQNAIVGKVWMASIAQLMTQMAVTQIPVAAVKDQYNEDLPAIGPTQRFSVTTKWEAIRFWYRYKF